MTHVSRPSVSVDEDASAFLGRDHCYARAETQSGFIDGISYTRCKVNSYDMLRTDRDTETRNPVSTFPLFANVNAEVTAWTVRHRSPIIHCNFPLGNFSFLLILREDASATHYF